MKIAAGTVTKPIRRGQRASLLALLLALFAPAALFASEERRALEVDELLESWQLEEGVALAEEVAKDSPEDPFALYALGRARFFQGKYKEAVELLDRALALSATPPAAFKAFRALAASTREVTKDAKELLTPGGHFLLRYSPRDEVLLPYAAEALEAAYTRLGEDFDLYPKGPIPVEFYGSPAELAKVSTLTAEEIETSGTIALCKFNRLMVTSPRALLQGYNWLDTIVHEYVHYLVSVKSRNTVPIWLHEGLAKYHEQRWRGEGGTLPPSQEQILAEALKRNHLISFDQMHPSMAKLPSQDDTALAFAEVFVAIEYIRGKIGAAGLRRILGSLRDGEDMEAAISGAMGVSFAAFLKDWTKYMKGRKVEDRPGLIPRKLVFKTDPKATPESDPAESMTHEEIPKEAKKYFRLGELLLKQGKSRAAVVELEKAYKKDPGYDLAVPMKLARAYLSAGAYASAARVADRVISLYPEYVGGHLVSGRALLALEDYSGARARLLEAVRLNPFDPDAHRDLKRALEGVGDHAGAEREQKVLVLLER